MFGKNKDPQENIHQQFESTQKYLEIDYIKDDLLALKDGSLHTVLMTSGISLGLRSEEEQSSVFGSFQSALNSLTFPIQILVQSRKADLTSYLALLENAAGKQKNELLKEQTEDYVYFLKDILSSVNVMDKRFFVVIPYYPNVLADKSSGILSLLGIKPSAQTNTATESYEQIKKQLLQRAEIVMSLLAEMGLISTPLPTEALIELFYACYNPETAGHEHIKNLGSLGAKYISTRKKAEEEIEE